MQYIHRMIVSTRLHLREDRRGYSRQPSFKKDAPLSALITAAHVAQCNESMLSRSEIAVALLDSDQLGTFSVDSDFKPRRSFHLVSLGQRIYVLTTLAGGERNFHLRKKVPTSKDYLSYIERFYGSFSVRASCFQPFISGVAFFSLYHRKSLLDDSSLLNSSKMIFANLLLLLFAFQRYEWLILLHI